MLVLPAAGPLAWFDPMPRGFVVGLAVNIALLVGVSLLTARKDATSARPTPSSAMPTPTRRPQRPAGRRATWRSCSELAARFIGDERAAEAFAGVHALRHRGL